MNIASRWWQEGEEGTALYPYQYHLSRRSQCAKEYLGINYKAVYQIPSPALDDMQNILITQIKTLLLNRSQVLRLPIRNHCNTLLSLGMSSSQLRAAKPIPWIPDIP